MASCQKVPKFDNFPCKKSSNLSDFFCIKEYEFRSTFFYYWHFLITPIFKSLYILKCWPIFDSSNSPNLVISFDYSWFSTKNLSNFAIINILVRHNTRNLNWIYLVFLTKPEVTWAIIAKRVKLIDCSEMKENLKTATCNYHGVSPQFLQPFSVDSADFPCRDPTIPSPCSFHGVKIWSVEFKIIMPCWSW